MIDLNVASAMIHSGNVWISLLSETVAFFSFHRNVASAMIHSVEIRLIQRPSIFSHWNVASAMIHSGTVWISSLG
jgi:hypothetical protein